MKSIKAMERKSNKILVREQSQKPFRQERTTRNKSENEPDRHTKYTTECDVWWKDPLFNNFHCKHIQYVCVCVCV